MGKGKKGNKAKSRKDEKFYNLAKAHGFRYGFLSIDLFRSSDTSAALPNRVTRGMNTLRGEKRKKEEKK
jgi:hypothetical protein